MGNREDEPGDAPSATGETLPAPSATGETVPSPPSATGETVLAPSPPSTRSARSTSAPAAPAPAPAASSSSRLGRYELLEQLGAGGMGVVHRGRDPALGRDLAIKLVRPRREGADARSRMVREAQAMARLHHPGVLPIFDVGSDGDRVFLVMPYMPGGTLGGWLRAAPRAVDAVVARFVAAGRGLAAAHALGMIHRDFKPDNVLLGAHGEVQVADFGLARLGEDDVAVARTATPDLASELTRTGDVMGTPAYMAPEQLAGEPVDARADQFSFCVALWEALCGRRPFDSGAAAGADALASLLAEILAGRIQPPPPERAVPASLLATLRRGLAADPAARWPSMDALLAALAPYAPSTTTTAGPAAPSPWPRRRRWLAVAAVPIALAAAAALWLRGRGEPGAPPPPIATATDAELAARCDRTGRPDGAACAALADRELRHLDGPPDFARAHGLALRACDAGIADGCAQVAELATWGNGVAVDRTRALALARRACDGGSGRGCGALGELVEARGEPGDAAAAVAAWRRACDLGWVDACRALGSRLRFGRGVPVDVTGADAADARAVALAAVCGDDDPVACRIRGMMALEGRGGAADPARGAADLQRACDLGYADACGDIGQLFTIGLGVQIDGPRGLRYLRRGCDGGAFAACEALAVMLSNGQGVPRDPAEARRVAEGQCRQRGDRGCGILASFYAMGQGVPRDVDHARDYYERACRGGDPFGCAWLGHRLRRSDAAAAIPLLRRACDLGAANACGDLGALALDRGDDATAADAYRLACDMGGGLGCAGLAAMYVDGRGVPRDVDRGRALFETSCAAQDPVACHDLAVRLRDGAGVPVDPYAALERFEQACTLSWGKACLAGAEMLEPGGPIAADPVRAAELRGKACDAQPTLCTQAPPP